jgi:hypothetical protein
MGLTEDMVTRVVGIHWDDSGGTFVISDRYNIFRVKVSGDNDAEWEVVGSALFGPIASSEQCECAASAEIVPDPSRPDEKTRVFVLGGGIYGYDLPGTIAASSDGKNWSHPVYSIMEDEEHYIGAEIMAIVWDDANKKFWAAAHMLQRGFHTPFPVDADFDSKEIDILLTSTDGFSWSEASRSVHDVSALPDAEYEPHTVGLLVPHIDNLGLVDSYGNPTPDGYYGYDEDTGIIIAPHTIPDIVYDTGGVANIGGSGIQVRQTADPPSPIDLPIVPDPAFHVSAVALAGGKWVAVGGDDGTQRAAVLDQQTDKDGNITYSWVDISPTPTPNSNGVIHQFDFITGLSTPDEP